MKKILIVDYGSQYTQLIAKKIRNMNVYCEIVSYLSFKINNNIYGVILSGGPESVIENNSHLSIKNISVPVLGICYGAQYIAKEFGGDISNNKNGEYGNTKINIIEKDKLTENIDNNVDVWMSHNDTISTLPNTFKIISKTNNNKICIFNYKNFYGVQFHPEVSHTICGNTIFDNYINICNIPREWTPTNFISNSITEIRKKLENSDSKVICALSGGVDSTIATHMVHKAIGNRLMPIIINNGLMRKNEYMYVLEYCKSFNMNVIGIDKSQLFYDNMKGVIDPEQKRKVIGKLFIDIFSEVATENNIQFLVQGTIYPDVIESISGVGKIKSHHNVGGLPEKMNLKLIEPLRLLFKDEVRKIGLELNIPKDIIYRHPFPGPGLALRILGEITSKKVKILQEADNIYILKLKEYNLYDKIWQAGAILLPVKSVGVMGDKRTYENVIALRAVESIDGMTADWYEFRKDFLSDVSNTIINNVDGINRVVYDISSKPPATIEWE